MIKKRILFAFLIVGLPLFVNAQKDQITFDLQNEWIVEANNPNSALIDYAVVESLSGTVTDAETGEPLPGVNILVKGTSTGTSTNSDGEFELEVESLQDTLVVSYIGYDTKEVPVNGLTELSITLERGAVLEELVVVGYGTQQRSDLTGSITRADPSDLKIPL